MDALAVNYWLSTFIGNGAGAVVSFLLNRTFTFKSGVSLKKGGVLFVAVITLCYTVSYGTSEWLSGHIYHLFPVSQQNLAVILGTCIYTITNYIGQKLIVFKQTTG
jgi:putative flippase GtrA